MFAIVDRNETAIWAVADSEIDAWIDLNTLAPLDGPPDLDAYECHPCTHALALAVQHAGGAITWAVAPDGTLTLEN